MDFSKLSRAEVLGAVASLVLVLSLFLLPWYDVDPLDGDREWICGEGDTSCTGWETFPILRWLLLLAASAPLILAWIVARGHTLSWAPGEMTMVVGFIAFLLILYNGTIDPVGSRQEEIGVSRAIGYYVALLSAVGISAAGIWRAMEAQRGTRKAPGTV